ncbi:MAG: AMP-binding protein, partial [Conexivisphaera sp.]
MEGGIRIGWLRRRADLDPNGGPLEEQYHNQVHRLTERTHGLEFSSYDELWAWSVERGDLFWRTLWEFFEIRRSEGFSSVREGWSPGSEWFGVRWFPGARLNYAENMLAPADAKPGDVAVLGLSETRPDIMLSWSELRDRTGSFEQFLASLGVGPGDVVTAIMPNIPETLVAMLATAALGAIWSAIPPELGAEPMRRRLEALRP